MSKEQPENCECCQRRTALVRLLALIGGGAGLALVAGCPGYRNWGQDNAGLAGSDIVEFARAEITLHSPRAAQLAGSEIFVTRFKQAGTEYLTALDRRCTHSGCRVNFDQATLSLRCPCHGSAFNLHGGPINGPARLPLTAYYVEERDGKVRVSTKPFAL